MKTPTPKHDAGHSHKAAHFITGMAVVAAGAASTLACAHVLSGSTLPGDVRLGAMIIGSTLTASLALMPMFLAPAYGDAIRKGNARRSLLGLTLMVLAVDGAMQMQAVEVVAKSLGHDHVNHVVAGALIATFQAATFFIRGSLIEAHNERKAAVAAQELAIEQERTKREKNKRQRDRRKAAKRAELKVVQGGKS